MATKKPKARTITIVRSKPKATKVKVKKPKVWPVKPKAPLKLKSKWVFDRIKEEKTKNPLRKRKRGLC